MSLLWAQVECILLAWALSKVLNQVQDDGGCSWLLCAIEANNSVILETAARLSSILESGNAEIKHSPRY
ncbi:hypothetical protein [Vibrio inusitatus]|uniref:hypothetical protein n=1 Tax=Vibrio inusitatus TaxID=413402 RepID=UPI001143E5FC|nr:hypothetical protein [Vibrio inusitatus]